MRRVVEFKLLNKKKAIKEEQAFFFRVMGEYQRLQQVIGIVNIKLQPQIQEEILVLERTLQDSKERLMSLT